MIVFAISNLGIGGAQVWVNDLVRLLCGRFETEIVYGGLYGGISEEDAFELVRGLKVTKIAGLHIPFNPYAIVQSYNYLRRNRNALVVVSSFAAGVNLRLAAFMTSTQIIYVSHGWSFRYKSFPGSYVGCILEAVLGQFSRILCVSLADLEFAKKILHIPVRNLSFIRNRIVHEVEPHINEPHAKLKANKKVLFVGRMAKPKRFDLYVDLSDRFPDVEFYALGPAVDEVPSMAGRVTFLGRIPDFDRYQDFDIFCLLSDSEGLPMSAIEAHVHGLPLILSNVGGCSELVKGNGVLVENDLSDVVSKFTMMIREFPRYKQSAMNVRGRFLGSRSAIIKLVEQSLKDKRAKH